MNINEIDYEKLIPKLLEGKLGKESLYARIAKELDFDGIDPNERKISDHVIEVVSSLNQSLKEENDLDMRNWEMIGRTIPSPSKPALVSERTL